MRQLPHQEMIPAPSLVSAGVWPRIASIVIVCILASPLQLRATLGVLVMSKDGVVIGIDSRITGGRHPGINCKVVRQGNTVIIASGTYDFLVDSKQFEFWDEARQALAHPGSIRDIADALDNRIEPLLQNGLSVLYATRPYLYRLHYRERTVLEFIVVGMDEKGRPSAYHYQYRARTPAEFSCVKHSILPPESTASQVEQIPLANPYPIFSPTHGSTSSEIADQITEFIASTRTKFPTAGIDGPVTTILIDKDGARFLNPGVCTAREH